MNEKPPPPTQYSKRLRIVHDICAIAAFANVFSTALHGLKSGRGDGPEVLAYAVITLVTAHAALFLNRRVYSPTENSGRFLLFFALIVGYLAAASGLRLLLSP